MNKHGMMMVCGNSIEELERDLAMLKMAVATGATMGCGGATLADAEKGVNLIRDSFLTTAPLPSPHSAIKTYTPQVCDQYEDEDEEDDPLGEAYHNLVDLAREMGRLSPAMERLLDGLADYL